MSSANDAQLVRARARRWARGGLGAIGISWGLACTPRPAAAPIESAPELVETAPLTSTRAAGGVAAARPELPSISAEADTSLSLPVYLAAGVPSVDHAWSARDYERCLAVFGELLRSGRGDLPRRGSARSGALFARLVAVENFRSADEAAPAERARRLEGYLGAYPGLLAVYSPANDGLDFSVEQAELIVSLLELLKSTLDSSRERAAEGKAPAEEYARQQQMTLGVVRGASVMLAEPERYAPALRQYMKAALVRLAPALERHLEPSAASEVHALAAADTEPLH